MAFLSAQVNDKVLNTKVDMCIQTDEHAVYDHYAEFSWSSPNH